MPHRTVIELDDDLLRDARRILDAKTIKETVNRALAEVVAGEARRRELARLISGRGSDLADPEVMRAAWD